MSTQPEPGASRVPPTPVTPVVVDGARYAPVLGDIHRDGQDVFFHSMRMEGGLLLIENERNERFEVDLATRRVTARHPAPPRSNIDPATGQPRMPPPMGDDDF